MKMLETNLQNTTPYWLVLQLNFIIVSQLIHNCKWLLATSHDFLQLHTKKIYNDKLQ
jgi:hypothetical protein